MIVRRMRSDALDNRMALVDAARRLFAERGAGVPLADIAAAAGVSRTTLHRHFSSRDDLAEEVLVQNVERIEHRAGQLHADADGARRLLAFVFDMQATDRSAIHILRADMLDLLAARTAAAFDPLVRHARRCGLLQPGVTTADILLALQMADAALHHGSPPRSAARARTILMRGLFV